MAAEKIFVGRREDIEQFKKVLARPDGEAVIVVGQAGMGKSWLVNKMAQIAEIHPDLKCGAVRYEVTPTDSVDSTMALMMDNAFEAAQLKQGSFDGMPQRVKQWKALLNIIKIGDLVFSLKRDLQRSTRDQFLKRLELISQKMPGNGRALFIIDPAKYMEEKSDQPWALVVKNLPEKIKLIFAQRPEDEIVKGLVFRGLNNVVHIPEQKLGVLKQNDVEDLVRLRADEVGQPSQVLQEAVRSYRGHPYAIQAALDVVKRTGNVEKLPQDPTDDQIAEAQWEQICASGDDAIKLFEAYTVLEVGVPDDVVGAVSILKATSRKRLGNDSYLRGLFRKEGEGKRIYHAILADYILERIGEAEKKKYHERAVVVYRERLHKDVKPDALAAMRLAEHVLAAEGQNAFVKVFVDECIEPLLNLGLLDTAMSLSKRALAMVEKNSAREAMVLGDLGLIYMERGEIGKVREYWEKALELYKRIGIAHMVKKVQGWLDGLEGNKS